MEVDVLEAQVTLRRRAASTVPPVTDDFVSKISITRSAAVIASCAIAKMIPRAAIGQTSDEHQDDERDQCAGGDASRPTASAPSSRR